MQVEDDWDVDQPVNKRHKFENFDEDYRSDNAWKKPPVSANQAGPSRRGHREGGGHGARQQEADNENVISAILTLAKDLSRDELSKVKQAIADRLAK